MTIASTRLCVEANAHLPVGIPPRYLLGMPLPDRNRLDALFGDAPGIGAAMRRLRDELNAPSRVEFFYGYFVQEDGLDQNDFVCGISRFNYILPLFSRAGGPGADPVARAARDWTQARRLDVRQHALGFERGNTDRRMFTFALERLRIRTVWIAPLNGRDVIGHAVLNQLHSAEGSASVIPAAELIPFGLRVHAALRRNAVLAREIGATSEDIAVAERLASGLSAAQIASQVRVSPRTVERHTRHLRRRLRARSTAEAIYKAVAYGLL